MTQKKSTAKTVIIVVLLVLLVAVGTLAFLAMNRALNAENDLAALQQAAAHFGYGPVWLTDPHRGNDLFAEEALYERSVLVIGSEGGGVAELEGAPRVHIPMPGNFESLNAAQAATIFLFEAVRRMRIAAHS